MLCFGVVATVALAQWLLAAPQLADVAVLISLYWVTLDGSPTAAHSPPRSRRRERSWRRGAGRRPSR